MTQECFSDAALVLIGHGTKLNADSAAPVHQHAAELRRRRVFAEVHEAFWKQEPQVTQVVSALTTPRVFLVPCLISEGYFSEEVIPEALGFAKDARDSCPRTRQNERQVWIYCRSVGTHPSMTGVLLERARSIVEQFPFPRPPQPAQTTLFIAGHGTEQNENSRRVVEEQVQRIRARNIYAVVHAVYLDEDPRIPVCYQMAPTRNLVVVPFFMSNGLHVREDIPVLLGEPERIVQERLRKGQPTWRNPSEKNGKLVWYAPSAGTDSRVADVILERVREAAGR